MAGKVTHMLSPHMIVKQSFVQTYEACQIRKHACSRYSYLCDTLMRSMPFLRNGARIHWSHLPPADTCAGPTHYSSTHPRHLGFPILPISTRILCLQRAILRRVAIFIALVAEDSIALLPPRLTVCWLVFLLLPRLIVIRLPSSLPASRLCRGLYNTRKRQHACIITANSHLIGLLVHRCEQPIM